MVSSVPSGPGCCGVEAGLFGRIMVYSTLLSEFHVFGFFSTPESRVPRKSMISNNKSIENRSILFEIGFQELHIGRGSMLTKLSPWRAVSSPFRSFVVDMSEQIEGCL